MKQQEEKRKEVLENATSLTADQIIDIIQNREMNDLNEELNFCGLYEVDEERDQFYVTLLEKWKTL